METQLVEKQMSMIIRRHMDPPCGRQWVVPQGRVGWVCPLRASFNTRTGRGDSMLGCPAIAILGLTTWKGVTLQYELAVQLQTFNDSGVTLCSQHVHLVADFEEEYPTSNCASQSNLFRQADSWSTLYHQTPL